MRFASSQKNETILAGSGIISHLRLNSNRNRFIEEADIALLFETDVLHNCNFIRKISTK